MLQNPAKKSIFQKQIPTILGLIILVVALIGGVFLIGDGTGVFAPRATAETTPRLVRITNVTDSSFTISFLTQDSTPGFVRYGTEANRLNSQSSDDRDQLTGTIGQYQTHHITVRGLNPNTEYFYELGTGSGATFNNDGSPFTIRTTQRSGAPAAAKTAYGSVNLPSGNPADGAIVYISIPGVGEMSSLVKATGSWAIPLSNARLADGSGFATISDEDTMSILIQGNQESLQSQFAIQVAQTQPVAEITLGQNPETMIAMDTMNEEMNGMNEIDEMDMNDDMNPDYMEEDMYNEADFNESENNGMGGMDDEIYTGDETESGLMDEDNMNNSELVNNDETSQNGSSNENLEGGLGSLLTDTQTPTEPITEINLDTDEGIELTTGNPVIRGTAPPGVTINIVVNSETQIVQQLIANEDGTFELDIAALSEELEPGEHSATYSYTDPVTGELVTKTVNFTVADPNANSNSQMLAQANTQQSQPYGSANPVPVGTESAMATDSATATDSAIGGATRSAMPATTSAIPVSGSVGTTLALVLGGLFFILAGGWSFWLAHEIKKEEIL